MNWTGVLPAMTTAFHPDFSVNHAEVAQHAQWLVQNGCNGIICLGSLAEASTLRFQEKIDILKTVVAALEGGAPGRDDLVAQGMPQEEEAGEPEV